MTLVLLGFFAVGFFYKEAFHERENFDAKLDFSLVFKTFNRREMDVYTDNHTPKSQREGALHKLVIFKWGGERL